MNTLTRQAFNALCKAYCEGYGVPSVQQQFSLTPTVQQKLQDKIVEQSTFLPKINVIPVDELQGQNILGCVTGPVSGRTDTSVDGKERMPRDVLGMEPYEYQLHQVNSDVYMTYKTMDVWAKFPDFHDRYTSNVQSQIANDRELVGWYGTHAAKDTDLSKYPLMQDVLPGWFQYMRDRKPENIISQGKVAGEIRIGEGGDYANLDLAVNDMLQGIPKWKRKGLVVMVGDELIARERAALLLAVKGTPTEKNAMNTAMATIGGLPWETPSNYSGRGLTITNHKNLSIYYQDGKWRRHIKDKPEKDRVEDFNSRNEGYVVEDVEQLVAVEFDNVKLPNEAGDGWV
ncbi:phage major capsid protein, P2 family [Halodesulfovibrio sp.]|uniref:phage major capsid protein, P2 family n=1 Tax=Halodesulfovibrio sp. TaxID=1912772 RepID=UPI0025D4F2B0|nr:phage major capsid protein, P2 family [Halodesulfovibrio sp.]MCT4627970.1 phage major capsid protein, P2 family [Halodesulfovibrio sp.]